MNNFSINSDLKTRPSSLTAAGIDKYLTTMASGLNGIGKAVMAAAKKHGINATCILAHAIHERKCVPCAKPAETGREQKERIRTGPDDPEHGRT